MTAIEQASTRIAAAVAQGETRGQVVGNGETIGKRIASIVHQIETKSEPDLIEKLTAQMLGYLQQLQQDQSRISQQDYDSQLKPQEDQIRQLLGRLRLNPQDRSALIDLQIVAPQVGISVQRFYPEQQPQPATPDQRRGGAAPTTPDVTPPAGDGEAEQAGQLEAALKTREVNNIMEVAEGIMDNADKVEFKVGGKYALVRYEKVMTNFGEQLLPVFVPENYVRWFRG